ncbi:hypothetical protein BGZ98_004008 [Dissophora globulifera]|nr:hypothetical protein BGZ98_004008 [Dissophora globulifera]
MDPASPTPPAAQPHPLFPAKADVVLNVEPDLPHPPLPLKSTSDRAETSSRARYCCCFPLSSGIWVLALFLFLPSVALVLCFNVANLQSFIQINSPAQVKIFYSVVYVFYAILGVAAAIGLPRLPVNRRIMAMIPLYWILITTTIIEGIYFGVIMSKQKSKILSYCDEPTGASIGAATIPAVSTNINGTLAGAGTKAAPHGVACHQTHAMIGVFYILGPGGWIVLHITWILIVVLYSKALRKQQLVNDEVGEIHMTVQPLLGQHGFSNGALFNSSRLQQGATIHDENKDKSVHDIGSVPGMHLHQSHPFHTASPMSLNPRRISPGLGTMFRGMTPWSATEQDRRKSESPQPTNEDNDDDDDDDDEDQDANIGESGYISNGSGGAHDGSSIPRGSIGRMSGRTDVPADGKGWWIRQIEGKRRGEICPCMMESTQPLEQDACWCGKQRRTSRNRIPVEDSSSEAGSSGTQRL